MDATRMKWGRVGRREPGEPGERCSERKEGSEASQLESVVGSVGLQRRLCAVRTRDEVARPGLDSELLGSPSSPDLSSLSTRCQQRKELLAMAYQPPPVQPQAEPTLTVAVSLVIAYLAYRAVDSLVPALAHDLVAKGLKGRDMLKPGFKRDDALSPDGNADDEDAAPGRKHLSVGPPSSPGQKKKRQLTTTITIVT